MIDWVMVGIALFALLVGAAFGLLSGYNLGRFDGEVRIWKLRDAEWDRNHGLG